MKLYLVRHGSYTPMNIDIRCPLSPEGQADITRLANYLSTRGLKIPTIFHSSKVRAIQTATLLAKAVNDGRCELHEGLEPEDPIQPMLNLINRQQDDLMLVGHLPFMGKLTDRLLTVDENNCVVDYQPGTTVCLSNDTGQWSIIWTLNSTMY